MRLTLRTMLAYLDDILEPADRDEIGHKIEESDFAKQLVSRIRESTHKLRLGAPKLFGKGPGMDPNTVAEYLDNTLAGERVPDFEKVCLESDTHLAEVAASHQILTLVLGQPVDVDPAMKRRIYGLIGAAEMPRPIEPVGAAGSERFPPGFDEGIIPGRQRVEVPDYLRDRPGSSKWRTLVAALALILLLCGAITMALGPLDRTNPVARWLGFGKPPENQVAQNKPAESPPAAVPASQSDKTASPDSGTPATPGSAATADNGEKSQSSTETSTAPSQPSIAPSAEDSTAKSTAETPPSATPSDSQASAAPPSTAPPTPEPGGSSGASMPTDATVSPPVPTDPGRSSPLPPQTEPASGSAAVGAAAAAAPAAAPAQSTDVLLGRLLPGKGVMLLKLDPTAGQWNRLAASSPLSAGDHLLVLPTFRPTLALSSGISLQVPSETLIELQPPDANGVPGVRLHFGRLVIMTTGQSGAKLRLDLGVASGLVLFTDSEATLAAEVRRFHPAGVNPETQDAQVAADLYAVSGRVQWTPADGAATTLNAPQRIVVAAHPSDPANGDAGKPIPKWIASEQLVPLNALAADDLVKAISDDKRPLLLELREMADSRRIECRSLAVQCLALLDQFEPLITALGDADERSVWPVHIASVRSALARGPATAAKAREAFQKQRGEDDGRELYRMLWGYTRDQLQGGDAAKLVAFLSNDNLDVRVLAFANLQEICHLTFNYRPDAQPASREGPVQRWQDQQRKGLIVPKPAT